VRDLRHRGNRTREECLVGWVFWGMVGLQSVSSVESGDLQRKAQLKLCVGYCANRG